MNTTNPNPINDVAVSVSCSDNIAEWANEYFRAKTIEGLSEYTLIYYRQQLGHFMGYCNAQLIENISQITTPIIRSYLLWMGEAGHNKGGQHGAFRVLKAFLRWYGAEVEPPGWRNPINRIKPPKLPQEPLHPVELHQVEALVNTCDLSTTMGKRDRALILFLLDTGARARECLAVDRADINITTGAVLIRKGKGNKSRTVFIGETARQALQEYLNERADNYPALWLGDKKTKNNRLTYGGLRQVLERRSKKAGIEMPSPHDFRRAFALNMLRNGCDLITLSRLMGHTTLVILKRYLDQLTEDLMVAHKKCSPVDNMQRKAAS